MAHFSYTSINKENKKLAGTIEAKNEEEARAELNNFGFSILSLTLKDEAEITNEGSSLPKFEFDALDKKGEKISGTIPAVDSYQAFKKLTDEYSFQVVSIYPMGASEEEKEKIKAAGISSLKIAYEQQRESEIALSETSEEAEFEKTHKELITFIDTLLKKIQVNIIEKYANDLSSARKKELQNLINKILRIKNSTNFNFIKNSCRELLEKVQQEELFVKEESRLKEKNKIKIDSKHLLIELNRIDAGTQDLSKDFKKLQEKLGRIPFLQKKITTILLFLEKISYTDERILTLKLKKRTLWGQLWDYGKIWIASSKEEKMEIGITLKSLWREYLATLKQIKFTKKQIAEENKLTKAANKNNNENSGLMILDTLNLFTGALLFFYLTYYFFANYFLTKDLPIKLSWNFAIYNSFILKYLITFIFLFHIATSLKITFFKKNPLSSFIIFPSAFLVLLIIFFNL